jgi:hypothetical protein
MRTRTIYKTKLKNKHGQSICKHNRECYRCTDCVGGGVCEHRRRRYQCRFCSPVGWAKRVLRDQRRHAAKEGYKPSLATPEEVINLRSKNKFCVLCERLLTEESPTLHHNHKTGHAVGFAHRRCNTAEGLIAGLSPKYRKIYIRNVLSGL